MIVALLALTGALRILAVDADNDGMDDAYELFFGLDVNSNDAALDHDDDTLGNSEESLLWTDPYAGDTDRDGWTDGVDSNTVSRAYINWGDPFFTDGDVYEYAAPGWWLNAEKAGGEWVTNAPGSWHVDGSETNSARLLIDIDSAILGYDAVMRLSIYDHTNAALYVDLMDSDAVVLATNLVGNLCSGTDAARTVLVGVPVTTYTNTTTIIIRRESGEVTVYETLLYVDQDADGLDIEQENQLGTSDLDSDTDGDGLSDYDEVFVYGTDPTRADTDGDGLSDSFELSFQPSSLNPLSSDTDGDGLSDASEVNTHGTDPNNPDSDGDMMGDGWEVAHGFNPLTGGALAGFWELDELSGEIAADSSSNGNDGAITGASHVAGIIVNALQFDGVDDMVTVANSPDYKPAALTVSCFARFDALFGNSTSGSAEDGAMVLVAQANAAGGYGYALYKTARNSFAFELANSAATNSVLVETSDALATTGEWYRVIGTYDGTNACLYIDGELAASAPYGTAAEYDSSTGLVFGNNPAGMDSSFLAGRLDSVRVLSGAMAAADVSEPYADPDGDGLSNVEESQYATNPHSVDGDGDGLSDYNEINTYGTDPMDSDTDNDGMPDGWEVANGLDPLSAVDASQDPDGDGRTNLQEYQLGTDPNNPDTDGDGMADGWEVANGLNPLSSSDALLDPDGDGLSNLGEYLAGTDIDDVDTDNDGMNDFIEVAQAHSNPLVADFDGTVTDISSVSGSAATGWLGSWTVEGDHIYARERSGYVDYSVSIPSNGIYALAVNVSQHNALTSQSEFDMTLYVDGVYSGRQAVNAPYGSSGEAVYFLPALDAGSHTVRIRWNNLEANTFLQINSLTLRTYGGSDTNSNGMADWMENRQADVSALSTPPATSIVSPVCIEGESVYQDMLSVTADYIPEGQTQQVITVMHGIRDGWYADIALSPTNATQVRVQDQNGAISYSNSVTWTELNILDNTYGNGLKLRDDSSVLLVAYPEGETNGTMTLEVLEGTQVLTNAVIGVGGHFEYLFDTAGSYAISGTYSNGLTLTNQVLAVDVVSASFPLDEIVCVASATREISCPSIPTNNVVIEYDPSLEITASYPLTGGTDFSILNRYDVPLYMLARLGEGGPILDNAKASTVYGDRGDYWRVVENYPDGSRLVMVSLQLGNVPPDLQVNLHIFAGGVTFDDGTIDMTLTADDFNELGVATYVMIQAPDTRTSVCHYTSFYQGAERID